MIDREKFFTGARATFGGKMIASQVAGINSILDEWDRRELQDLRHLGYILATTKWETASTMQPITELGSQKYLRGKPYWPWIGRGYVQLTWKSNYLKFRDRVHEQFDVDIIVDMTAALRPNVAAFIMFEGMLRGEFTGRKLGDFFNGKTTDWLNARRIINGTDRASIVAALGKSFFADLTSANQEKSDV